MTTLITAVKETTQTHINSRLNFFIFCDKLGQMKTQYLMTVSVHKGQMTTLNVIFHVLVPVYRLVKI